MIMRTLMPGALMVERWNEHPVTRVIRVTRWHSLALPPQHRRGIVRWISKQAELTAQTILIQVICECPCSIQYDTVLFRVQISMIRPCVPRPPLHGRRRLLVNFFANCDCGEILCICYGRTVQCDDCRSRYHSKCLGFNLEVGFSASSSATARAGYRLD